MCTYKYLVGKSIEIAKIPTIENKYAEYIYDTFWFYGTKPMTFDLLDMYDNE